MGIVWDWQRIRTFGNLLWLRVSSSILWVVTPRFWQAVCNHLRKMFCSCGIYFLCAKLWYIGVNYFWKPLESRSIEFLSCADMVKNKGFLPSGPGEIQVQRKQIKAIINSLLPACVATDTESGNAVPFRAQAIIANPPAYGTSYSSAWVSGGSESPILDLGKVSRPMELHVHVYVDWTRDCWRWPGFPHAKKLLLFACISLSLSVWPLELVQISLSWTKGPLLTPNFNAAKLDFICLMTHLFSLKSYCTEVPSFHSLEYISTASQRADFLSVCDDVVDTWVIQSS